MENLSKNETENIKEKEVKKPLLKPTYDVVFHALFREGNENITKAMVSAATKQNIKSINVNNDRNIIGQYPEEKIGIVDLKATLDNGTICDIEIQLADNKDTAERFLYYWSRIYSSQLSKGDEYSKLNKVIGIIILDYKFDKTKELKELSTKWKIKEVTTGNEIVLTDALELYIIEIPKAREIIRKDPTNKLAQWIMFLDNPNESEVSKIMEENNEIKEAAEKLEEISNDEELRILEELKEKALKDENSWKWHLEHDVEFAKEEAIKRGREEGLEQGREQGREEGREEGLKQGRDEGLKQGRDEGIEQGKREEKIEIAKQMKKEKIATEMIKKITGLTKEEIDNI